MTPVIEAQNISRKFGKKETEVLAVNDVSLSLSAGEMLTLMGPSGSGKTTLLAMLGCILKPTSGQLQIVGRNVADLSSEALARLRGQTIGFIFQEFNLLSALNAWENVALMGDILAGRSRSMRDRSIEILKNIGLGHRLYSLPENLSAGEKQRVAFARAIVNNPTIILADEPTANLDSDNRNIITALLRQAVIEKNVSVVIATHDERIRQLADRVLRIEDGRLSDNRVNRRSKSTSP